MHDIFVNGRVATNNKLIGKILRNHPETHYNINIAFRFIKRMMHDHVQAHQMCTTVHNMYIIIMQLYTLKSR